MVVTYIVTETSQKFDRTLRKLTRYTYHAYTLPLTLEHTTGKILRRKPEIQQQYIIYNKPRSKTKKYIDV